jgi:hypothetical protein
MMRLWLTAAVSLLRLPIQIMVHLGLKLRFENNSAFACPCLALLSATCRRTDERTIGLASFGLPRVVK